MQLPLYRWLGFLFFMLCPVLGSFAQSQPSRPTNATVSVVEELAAALVAAKTEEECATLLAAKKELQTPALVQALLRRGDGLRTRPDRFPPEAASQAIAIFQLAQRIAEQIGDKAAAAKALSEIGNVHRNQGNQNLALEFYRKSLVLHEDLGDKAGSASVRLLIGFAYSALAASYRQQKNYGAALETYQEALRLFGMIGQRGWVATTFLNLGIAYSAQENYATALEHYQQSLTLREAFNDWPGVATLQSHVGDAYRLQKNYEAALEAYQKVLIITEASADQPGMVRALNNLALVYTEQGQESLAREAKQRSQTLNENSRLVGARAPGNAEAVLKLADRLLAVETDEARQALLEVEKTLVTRELLSLLMTRGGQFRQQNNHTKAISSYRLAAQTGEQLGDKIAVALAVRSIAATYFGQHNTRMAEEYFQKSLALWERIGIQAGIAQSLNFLANVSNMQENYSLALSYTRKARTIAEAIGNKELRRNILGNMAWAYREIGNHEQAAECLTQAVDYAEAVGDQRSVAHLLHSFFPLYHKQSQFELARQSAQRSLFLFEELGDKPNVAHLWSDLANLERRQNNYIGALEHYQKSITQFEALGNKMGLTTPLLGLAETYYRQGNYGQALQLTERAATIARPLGYTRTFTSSSYGGPVIAGKAYRALNQPTQAQAAFAEAIAIIETLRLQLQGGEQEGQNFFEDKLVPYHEMVGLLVTQQQPAAALTFAERAKARTLLDVLRNDRADVVKALTAEEQTQEQRLKNALHLANAELLSEHQRQPADAARLAALQEQQQKARQSFEAFQTGLYSAHPELKIKRGEAPILRPEEISALLPNAQTALLEFVVAEEQTFLFVITKNTVRQPLGSELKVYPLAITAKEVSKRATAYRQQLANRSPEFGDAARALYDLLLKPAAAQLRGQSALVIVPDGPLWELPFQSLQHAPNRYLIEDYAISYAPSLTVLREMLKPRGKTTNPAGILLAFGNPALGRETGIRAKTVLMDVKFNLLPEAERQINSLTHIYGARQSKVYVGAKAREEHAKAEAASYRILHLATHGVLNDASPMYSHVLLAQPDAATKGTLAPPVPNEDGLLEAWELMKLDLNADLVVLSACETARGRVGAGEGVIGLTWALFVAGCPRTVVSQWKVEEVSTSDLMVAFHRALKPSIDKPQASLQTARALQTAAKKLLTSTQYRHPFYWAGFVVVGVGY